MNEKSHEDHCFRFINLNKKFKLKNHCAQYNGNATYVVAFYTFARGNTFGKHASVVFAHSAYTNCSLRGQASPIGYALEKT